MSTKKQGAMYGVTTSDPQARVNYRQLLLQYCRLDTAVMAMVWRRWSSQHRGASQVVAVSLAVPVTACYNHACEAMGHGVSGVQN